MSCHEGGPTIFWELFTVIPCVPKHFKRYIVIGSQIETEGSLKIEEAFYDFLAQNDNR